LSPEEKAILADFVQTHGDQALVSTIEKELKGESHEHGEFDENMSGTDMDDKEYKVRGILHKI